MSNAWMDMYEQHTFGNMSLLTVRVFFALHSACINLVHLMQRGENDLQTHQSVQK